MRRSGTRWWENSWIRPFFLIQQAEGPLNRFGVTVAFHGQAQAGAPQGSAGTGVWVFNVALPLLKKMEVAPKGCRVVEV